MLEAMTFLLTEAQKSHDPIVCYRAQELLAGLEKNVPVELSSRAIQTTVPAAQPKAF